MRAIKGGQPCLDNRTALIGILFVLCSGILWDLLPVEMGCGLGITCWRWLHEQALGDATPSDGWTDHAER